MLKSTPMRYNQHPNFHISSSSKDLELCSRNFFWNFPGCASKVGSPSMMDRSSKTHPQRVEKHRTNIMLGSRMGSSNYPFGIHFSRGNIAQGRMTISCLGMILAILAVSINEYPDAVSATAPVVLGIGFHPLQKAQKATWDFVGIGCSLTKTTSPSRVFTTTSPIFFLVIIGRLLTGHRFPKTSRKSKKKSIELPKDKKSGSLKVSGAHVISTLTSFDFFDVGSAGCFKWCLFVCLFACLLVCLFVFVFFVSLFVCLLFAFLFVCLLACLFIYFFVALFVVVVVVEWEVSREQSR